MTFARRVFRVAAIYGFFAIIPQYFLEDNFVRQHPPAFAHPAFYYGFVGLALTFQVLFWLIAGDPARYRPLMLVGVMEKVTFAFAAAVLKYQGRIEPELLLGAALDLVLGALFVAAYIKTDPSPRALPPAAPPV